MVFKEPVFSLFGWFVIFKNRKKRKLVNRSLFEHSRDYKHIETGSIQNMGRPNPMIQSFKSMQVPFKVRNNIKAIPHVEEDVNVSVDDYKIYKQFFSK